MKLSVAILAGGKSQRMGSNKSFLMYENQTFIDRILAQLGSFDEVLISVGDSKQEYEHLPYKLVEDEVNNIGPLGGIHACLKLCRNEHLFVCATDMPCIQRALVEFIVEFISSDYDCFVLKSKERVQPLCAVYKKSLIPLIENLLCENKYSLHELCDRSRTKYISLKYSCFDESVIANINSVSDMTKKPVIFAVSGVKNSGKTTLITKLICHLKAEGYSIGVIKHDGHEFEVDTKGTDTYLFRQAGSDAALIYSQTKFALVKSFNSLKHLKEPLTDVDFKLQHVLDYLCGCDIVIVEGLKHSNLPKIEVVLESSVCSEEHVLAFASDNGFKHEKIPTFSREDVPNLITVLKKHFCRFLL